MPEFDAVNVYDTSTLALLFSITDPAIVRPTGVALRPQNLTLAINIDIKPGSFPNGINRKSKGVIPVAILSTENFDASSIGSFNGRIRVKRCRDCSCSLAHRRRKCRRFPDLLLHFKTTETWIACGDTFASVAGQMFGGQALEGVDSIRTVPCR